MDIDFEGLTKGELRTIIRKAEKALASIDSRRKAEAKKAAESAAKEYGFSLDELLDGKPQKGKKGVAKYRNPENPDQTWTGKGRKPGWVIAALETGKTYDDLAI